MLWKKFWRRLLIRDRERIYIVPTAAGTAYLLFTISLLLMGAIYTNQLVNLMAFLLLTLYALAMVMTHQNMQGLSKFDVTRAQAFAGEVGSLDLSFLNKGGRRKEGLRLDLLTQAMPWTRRKPAFSFAVGDDLTERSWVPVLLPYSGSQRGRFPIRRLRVSTTAPLGLFRAWRSEAVNFDIWIYPQRMASDSLPTRPEGEGDDQHQKLDRADTWADAFPAEFGGSVRRMDWARFARTDQAWVRPWYSESGERQELDWEKYLSLHLEQRLSHFSFAVDRALHFGEELVVRGPWGERKVDPTTSRELLQLWAEWKA